MKKIRNDVYSKVVGYTRPTRQWNDAKSEEWKKRTLISIGRLSK